MHAHSLCCTLQLCVAMSICTCVYTYLDLAMATHSNGNPLQYSCLENPRDRGAWWAAVYGVAQSRTRLKRFSSSSTHIWTSQAAAWAKNQPAMQESQDTQVRSLDQERCLEEATAAHSSVLAWRTPWTGEPGRLHSTGSQRVGQD